MRRKGGNGYWRAGVIAPGFTHEGVLPALTEKAVSFIGKQSPAKPFLLYLPLTGPHTPWMPTAEFRGKSGADYYGDFVVQVDAAVGRVLGALDQAGVAAKTLVIFTSDNGPQQPRYNAGMPRLKGTVHEGGIRAPLFVRWPGVFQPRTVDRIAAHIDVMPTLLGVTGVAKPPAVKFDGVSLSPLLRGEGSDWRTARCSFSGTGGHAGAAGVRHFHLLKEPLSSGNVDRTRPFERVH